MKKYIFLFLLSILVFSCTDDFEELNTDKKNPTIVPAGALFTNAVRNIFDLLEDSNSKKNAFRLFAQYWATSTFAVNISYEMHWLPDTTWDILYLDVLKNLQEAKRILSETVTTNDGDEAIKQNKVAIIEIMEAYIFTTLVDIFGDVPFSEALDANNTTPVYEDAKRVYYANIDNLMAAVNKLEPDVSAFSAVQDLIYEGDIKQWIKFGHTLHLKLAMRIVDVDPAKAAEMVADSKDKVFTSHEDNFTITYYSEAPNTNPIWVDLVQNGKNYNMGANTIIDIMNSWNDPRLGIYFDSLDDGSYVGAPFGGYVSSIGISALGDAIQAPDLPGVLLSYDEVEFLLAEAAERGIDIDGSAEDHYNAAITASILYWGGDESMVADYLAEPGVAYSTAAGEWRQKIGVQKWLSLYNNGLEGWTTWRLFDFNGFNAPQGMSIEDIPLRFIYPASEANLNSANYVSAASKYNGDVATAKIFWDVN